MRTLPRLVLLALFCVCPTLAASEARLLGQVRLEQAGLANLGGLSAIEVAPDGTRAMVLSDRGLVFPLQLIRSDGRLAQVRIGGGVWLRDTRGERLPGGIGRDAEGLAWLPDGRLLVSYEGDMRIAVHRPDGMELDRFATPIGAPPLPANKGFEALAVDATGIPFTISEAAPPRGTANPVYRRGSQGWQTVGGVTQPDGYRAVALDFDDTGRLYLLERWFAVPFGFLSRITRFDMEAGRLGAGTTVLQTVIGDHGNLEGLSVWRAASGQLVATMVSDDNYIGLLPSTIVEYVLPD